MLQATRRILAAVVQNANIATVAWVMESVEDMANSKPVCNAGASFADPVDGFLAVSEAGIGDSLIWQLDLAVFQRQYYTPELPCDGKGKARKPYCGHILQKQFKKIRMATRRHRINTKSGHCWSLVSQGGYW